MKTSFSGLEVWKEAFEFTIEVYRITGKFPKEEKYALTSQLKRAASSVPANIAEGRGRGGNKEFCRFLYIARGSLEESKSHLLLANGLGYIDESDIIGLEEKTERLGAMLNNLIVRIQKSI